ncbi:phosphatases II [Exidia glandulosa HHB12029]|uniref:phosphatidylinositol-3,4,5-trisphosphate 3-phosphatase n=1 Tax=Exidia glandulosa HHB12029 TaxID=1314781 RepID=A0A165BI65_EXIGL|nr:phosphatases II [Exidia glandulosa HHB12029]
MANYVRRIVSGYKARFRDETHGVDLDLIYLTDQVIIMGFPAEGIEGYYRNRREHVKKFLDSRHKDNYWVFNLCPLTENSYPASYFEGRVSRHPFPDHHAPPLAILALAAREMREWLQVSEDRVAVIHCKAGKGRSGTIACSYLLAQDSPPTAPMLERSHTTKDWARTRANELLEAIELEEEELEASQAAQAAENALTRVDEDAPLTVEPKPTTNADSATDTQETQVKHAGPALEEVLALHTSRRMQRPSSPGGKQKRGVSIPSQRRFLSYWALVLAHAAPTPFWSLPPTPHPKVRLREMRVRLREPSGAKMAAMKLVNTLLETAGVQQGRKKAGRDVQTDELWVSLARYNDDFVDTLEGWERHTRDPSGRMGVRRPDAERMQDGTEGEQRLSELFEDGRWDKSKQVKIFSHLSTTDVEIAPSTAESKTRQLTYVLHPISNNMWVHIRKKIKESAKGNIPTERSEQDISIPASASATPEASRNPSMENIVEGEGLLLDACREVRAKLYLGQIFLGWFWFIPIFHMTPGAPQTAHFVLERQEIDFSVGAGAWIVDVDVALDWVGDAPAEPAPKATDASVENLDALEEAQDDGVKVQDAAA